MARSMTGVDVGSRTSVVLRGHPKGNTFAVTGFWAGSFAASSAAEAWRAARPPFKPGATCVGLSGREVNIRYTQVPRLPDWQLKKLMRFEALEIGGQAGTEMASDFNVLPELPEIEGEDVVLLAMARESLLEEHAEGLASVGGRLDHFTPNAIALYNAWLHYGVIEDDTVLVANVGHENIDVVIVRGTDLVFARNLAGGAKLFDEAIAERFDVSLERAEVIKAEVASLSAEAARAGGNREKARGAILGAAGQILSLLQSAVLFCKTQIKLSGLTIDRVALCGGGAALDGLDQYLETAMKVRVEHFDPFGVVDVGALTPAEADLLDEYRLEAVVALGLATSAARDGAYAIEILPGAVRRRREFWGGTALSIAAAVLCLVYLGVRAFKEHDALVATQAEVVRLRSSYNSARRADQEARDLLDANAKLSKLVSTLWLEAGSGEQMARAVAVLQRALPADFWLTELTTRRGFLPELGVERGDERPILHIEGRVREGTDATSVQFEDFLAALTAELAGVRLVPGLSPAGDRFTLDLCLVTSAGASGAEPAEQEG
jgi:Tfp pilus assembly PilM family ATPase